MRKKIITIMTISMLLLLLVIQTAYSQQEYPKPMTIAELEEDENMNTEFLDQMGKKGLSADKRLEDRGGDPKNYKIQKNEDKSITIELIADGGEELHAIGGETFPMKQGTTLTFKDGELTKANIVVPEACLGSACPPSEEGEGYRIEGYKLRVGAGGATIEYEKGAGENGKGKVTITMKGGGIIHKPEKVDQGAPDMEFEYKIEESSQTQSLRFEGGYELEEVNGDYSLTYDTETESFAFKGIGSMNGATVIGETNLFFGEETLNTDKPYIHFNLKNDEEGKQGELSIYSPKGTQGPAVIIGKDNQFGINVKETDNLILYAGAKGTNPEGVNYDVDQAKITISGSEGQPLITIQGAGIVVNGIKGIYFDDTTQGIRTVDLTASNEKSQTIKNIFGISDQSLEAVTTTPSLYDFKNADGSSIIQINRNTGKETDISDFLYRVDENGNGNFLNRESLETFQDARINQLSPEDQAALSKLSKQQQLQVLSQSEIPIQEAIQNQGRTIDETITAGNRVPSNKLNAEIQDYNPGIMNTLKNQLLTDTQKQELARAESSGGNYMIMFSSPTCTICKVYENEFVPPLKEGWNEQQKVLILKVKGSESNYLTPDPKGSFPYFMASQ